MDFNEHSRLKGAHAFLSASQYHWLNYDETRLVERYSNHREATRGTQLHAFADQAIRLGIRLPANGKTLNRYVNDAIGFRMHTEQVLYYSRNAFGTADAISFGKNLLRIHDLKTGVIPASPWQLRVYAAFFCLEYNLNPEDIKYEGRIYQLDDIQYDTPTPDVLRDVMDKVQAFDLVIESLREVES